MGNLRGVEEVLVDHQGLAIRLSAERMAHILDPEMTGLEAAISETLRDPALVIQSISDETARLYYRFYSETLAGDKFLCGS